MRADLSFQLSKDIYVRNPEDTELGKKIIRHSIILFHKIGFESFTFKKLAKQIGTTEAGIYRYFANKHMVLIYLVDWYWSWQEYRLTYHTNNVKRADIKIKQAIKLLSSKVEDDIVTSHINESLLYEVVMAEGAKAYLTKHVAAYNKAKLFKPYKDLCAKLAAFIKELNPQYKFPHSLSSTVVEMAHSQKFYMHNLPSLTDFGIMKDEKKLVDFLEDLVFSSVKV